MFRLFSGKTTVSYLPRNWLVLVLKPRHISSLVTNVYFLHWRNGVKSFKTAY